ncbi:MAG: hypothetical protein AAF633_08800, partial [Chloroflexota bacterium]
RDLSPTSRVQNGIEKRISFIVRVTVDEANNPLRTEIEHAQSKIKKVFVGLDRNQLTDFIVNHIDQTIATGMEKPNPLVTDEIDLSHSQPAPSHQNFHIYISDVAILRADYGSSQMNLIVGSHENFMVQVSFNLEERTERVSLSPTSALEINLYAYELTKGKTILLCRGRIELEIDRLTYSPILKISTLSEGVYRIKTMIKHLPSSNLIALHEGPFFRVANEIAAIPPFSDVNQLRQINSA